MQSIADCRDNLGCLETGRSRRGRSKDLSLDKTRQLAAVTVVTQIYAVYQQTEMQSIEHPITS